MATNKNAILRYNTLDKCFQNSGKRYSIDDLLEEVNHALFKYDPNSSGIRVRQLRDDIKFMKSEEGYFAPIKAFNDNGIYFYRYEDHNFSINSSPLNATESEQLKAAISILERIGGGQEFNWAGDLAPKLTEKFGFQKEQQKVMGYESNEDYVGNIYITPIFNAIINKTVISLKYEPFGHEVQAHIIHPHYLKQYNNRWYVLGKNEENNIETWILALDRIKSVQELQIKYTNSNIDWEDYFSDFIGVTKIGDEKAVEVKLVFSPSQASYLITKPLHETQKNKTLADGSLEVRVKLIPNYELTSKLLSFGAGVKVIEPITLKKEMKKKLEEAYSQY
jgi:predicted DNA-binding transcriptional regulator YafY